MNQESLVSKGTRSELGADLCKREALTISKLLNINELATLVNDRDIS